MRKEVKKQKVLRFMADFETLTGKDVVDATYVWASGVCSIDNPYNEKYLKIWNNDEGLYKFLSQFPLCECFFHNLKFDGSFILDYLMRYDYTQAYSEAEQRWLKNSEMPRKSFRYLISDMGQWYTIIIKDINN